MYKCKTLRCFLMHQNAIYNCLSNNRYCRNADAYRQPLTTFAICLFFDKVQEHLPKLAPQSLS